MQREVVRSTILPRAQALAPRRTGQLAASIRPFATARGAGVRSRLPYAGLVHYGGTIRPRGVPITFRASLFADRAAEESMDRYVDELGDAVDALAARHGFR